MPKKRPPPRGLVPMTPRELRSEFQREANERRTLTTVEVSPPTVGVIAGATQQFLATGRDPNGDEISVSPRWSVDGEGSINQHGLYTAGGSAGAATVVAKVRGGPSGAAAVEVLELPIPPDEPGIPHVFPAEVLVQPGADYQFVLLVDGEEADADSWDCTGGTIDSDGLFTAAVTPGEFTVTATKDAVEYEAVVEVVAFDPRTDVADLYRWGDVETMGLATNAEMDTITDSSGGGHDFYIPRTLTFPTERKPLSKTSVLNGYAVAESDGSSTAGDVMYQYPPSGAHTTFFLVRVLPGGDHDAGFEAVFQRAVDEGHGGESILGSVPIYGVKRWVWAQLGQPAVILDGDPESWSLLTLRLNSADSLEVGINDGDLVEVTPVAGMFEGPTGLEDRIFAHNSTDAAKMQTPHMPPDFTRAITNTELRRTKRWLNGGHRIY